ncbi:ABC transporter ATP-binding protein [Ferrovibrio terrae]|uniref:ABC transporter ATP-binding protein n=1 Tax=Ferrovibrio terrae TaxID=2594003 RepID=UPI0031382E50
MPSFLQILRRRLPLKNLLRVLRLFIFRYPMAAGAVIGSLLIANILEGLGILTLLPLLSLAVGQGMGSSRFAAIFTDALDRVGLTPSLEVLLSLMVTIVLLKSALTWFGMKYVGHMMARVQTDLRLDFINSMLAARWSYFVSQPTGRLANAVGGEPERAASTVFYAVNMLVIIIQGVIYIGAAMLVSLPVALGALVTGFLMISVLSRYVRIARAAGEGQTQFLSSLMARFVDAIQGIKPIKSMALEKRFLPLLEHEARGLNAALERQVVATSAVRSLQEPVATVVMAGGLYIILSAGVAPITEIMVLALLFWRAAQTVGGFQKIGQSLVAGESALWSLIKTTKLAQSEAEPIEGNPPPALSNAITLAHVDFSYGDRVVLKDMSLTIPANQITAVIGPSGSGKTTIADLVIGLYRPLAGDVQVDGVSLRQINLHDWRETIGYVPQETSLFAESILVNVTLGDPALSETDAIAALQAAGLGSFIAGLPQGIHTSAGERGLQLSGGQRQRIAMARALVRKPRLLILDEATTALDPQTEAAICQTLRELSQQVTILAISHQTAIVNAAHHVYQLDSGQLCSRHPVEGAA